MNKFFSTVLLLMVNLFASEVNAAQTIITCSSGVPRAKFELHPSIYLDADQNTLCFNVTSWPGFRGTNCVRSGGQARWNAIVLMFDKSGESLGRDETDFRVSNVLVTNENISYLIEWGRYGNWLPKQRIEVNRLTGNGVDWFLTEHGGLPIKCTGSARKF